MSYTGSSKSQKFYQCHVSMHPVATEMSDDNEHIC